MIRIFSTLGWLRLKLRFTRFAGRLQKWAVRLSEPIAWRVRYVLVCRWKVYQKKTGGIFDEYLQS